MISAWYCISLKTSLTSKAVYLFLTFFELRLKFMPIRSEAVYPTNTLLQQSYRIMHGVVKGLEASLATSLDIKTWF